MKKYTLPLTLLTTGLLFGCNGNSQELVTTPNVVPVKKNVVLIYADDLGWGQFGFNGQKIIKTPNLDEYSAMGLKFNNFYSSAPFCPPARNSLMVGMDTAETVWRVNDMVFGREPTMAQLFKAYGYDTSMYGKWGMSVPKLSASEAHQYKLTCSNMEQFYSTLPYEFEQMGDPIDAGFDHFVGFMDHRDAHVYYHDSPDTVGESTPEHPYNADVIRQDLFTIKNGQIKRYPTNSSQYLPDVYLKEALDHMEDVVSQGKPFFMYIPTQLPHAELVNPPDMTNLYTDSNGNSIFPETPFYGDGIFYRKVDTPRATFARMVTKLDSQVAQVVRKLQQLGVYKDTIIIFTSDNGRHTAGGIGTDDFFNSDAKIRGHKWELLEGGIRVPTIMFGGGVVGAKTIDTRYVQYQLKDTFEEMLSGNQKPYSFYQTLNGGESDQLEYLYFQFLHTSGQYQAEDTRQVVIKGDWKLIRYGKENPTYKLFNLSYDEKETTDYWYQDCNKSLELLNYLNSRIVNNELPLGNRTCYY